MYKPFVRNLRNYAVYSEKMDTTYESVFNRADEDMYENKVRMKAEGKVSKVIE